MKDALFCVSFPITKYSLLPFSYSEQSRFLDLILLDENYGEVFVSEFMNNLSSKYGLETQEFDVPEVSDDVYAVGAFAGGTGGLGGGGGA